MKRGRQSSGGRKSTPPGRRSTPPAHAPLSIVPASDSVGSAPESPDLTVNAVVQGQGLDQPAAVVSAPTCQTPVAPIPATHVKESSVSGSSSRPSSSRAEEFLGFCLDAEEYCVWIRSVKEIIKPLDVTPIPRSSEDILGLISLRGTIVPIFNIRRRLRLSPPRVGTQSRVIVFYLDTGAVGILVDRVTEVISVDPETLEPPPATLGKEEAAFVTAIVPFRERLIGVLHLERLVAIEPSEAVRSAA